jgi:hypothetical protein
MYNSRARATPPGAQGGADGDSVDGHAHGVGAAVGGVRGRLRPRGALGLRRATAAQARDPSCDARLELAACPSLLGGSSLAAGQPRSRRQLLSAPGPASRPNAQHPATAPCSRSCALLRARVVTDTDTDAPMPDRCTAAKATPARPRAGAATPGPRPRAARGPPRPASATRTSPPGAAQRGPSSGAVRRAAAWVAGGGGWAVARLWLRAGGLLGWSGYGLGAGMRGWAPSDDSLTRAASAHLGGVGVVPAYGRRRHGAVHARGRRRHAVPRRVEGAGRWRHARQPGGRRHASGTCHGQHEWGLHVGVLLLWCVGWAGGVCWARAQLCCAEGQRSACGGAWAVLTWRRRHAWWT